MSKQRITVLGSFVVDLTSLTPHLPARGETVFGGPFKLGPGGKGSNQGVAAQKAGAEVTMITKLGKDIFSDVALKSFRETGMKTNYIFCDEKYETGVALIEVEENSGENAIVVSAGACRHLTVAEIETAREDIKTSKIFLTQLETNLDASYYGIDMAASFGVKVILNPAPAQRIAEDVYKKIDIITPNESEAEILSGIKIQSLEDAADAAEFFIRRGVRTVIITLGGKGVYLRSDEFTGYIPAFKVDNVVDTTGAGDAFNGGLAVALAEEMNIRDAVSFASAAAAISITRFGTAPAMPGRCEIDEFLKNNSVEG